MPQSAPEHSFNSRPTAIHRPDLASDAVTDASLAPKLTDRVRALLPALTSRRSANIVFGAALVLGFLAMLAINRHSWFTADDFAYLYKSNEVFEKGDYVDWLLSPHNEHWAMLPVVIFRVLFAVFGMNHFLPYLVPVLVAHLVALVILRALMVRAGVRYWVATGLCIAVIIFGGGAQNLNWAFQIGFVGSVMFGLAQILCVDHDGPINARDLLGLLFGFLAISTQGPGITMVIIATLLLVFRRRFRAAALQAVPLATIYLVWFLAYGRGPARPETTPYLLAQVPSYIWTGVTNALNGLLQMPGAAVVALVVLIAAVLVIGPTQRAATATAMFVGIVVFFAINAYGRISLGPQQAGESRYVYVAGLLAAVALGLALCAVPLDGRRRWIPALLIISWMAVANTALYYVTSTDAAAVRRDDRRLVTAMAAVPGIDQADPNARPIPGAPDVSVGRTIRYTDDGSLLRNPNPSAATLLTVANGALVMTGPAHGVPAGARFVAGPERVPIAGTAGCATLTGASPQSITIGPGTIDVTLTEPGNATTTLQDPVAGARSSERSLTFPAGTTRVENRSPAAELVLAFSNGSEVAVCGLTNP